MLVLHLFQFIKFFIQNFIFIQKRHKAQCYRALASPTERHSYPKSVLIDDKLALKLKNIVDVLYDIEIISLLYGKAFFLPAFGEEFILRLNVKDTRRFPTGNLLKGLHYFFGKEVVMEKSKQIFIVMLFILGSGLAWGSNNFRGRDLAAEPELDPVKTKNGKHKYVPNQIIIKYKEKAANKIAEQRGKGIGSQHLKVSSSLDALHKKHSLQSIRPIFKNHKKNVAKSKAILKKNPKSLNKKEKHLVQRLKRAPKNAKLPALDRIHLLDIKLMRGESLEDIVEEYNQDPDVDYAELNFIVSVNDIPNDPLYSFQWALENTAQTYPASGSYNDPPGTVDVDIDASVAWDTTLGSANIVVAVVDTGVDYYHRDLQGNIWTNDVEINGLDGADDDMNGFVDDKYGYDFEGSGYFPDSDPIDDHGHGTHVAGTIGAKGNNGLDVVGVCWDVKIMPVKFLAANGTGSIVNGELSVEYAIVNGADVISNSWGGGPYAQSMQEMIDFAYSQGIIVVAAAGNANSSSIHYPAGYNHVISVAATDSNDDKASFSNYGDWVNIAAPGVDILSLRANGTSLGTPYDDYTTTVSGTSMACPHVSGACATILSVNPLVGPDEMLNILTTHADALSDTTICSSDTRLNLNSALNGAITPLGKIDLEHDYYSCLSEVKIKLFDSDLSSLGSVNVTLSTDSNDLETITLYENSSISGYFTSSIYTDSNPISAESGLLEILHGNIITVTYQDVDDGTGNSSVASDTAVADCQYPIISNISIQHKGPEPEIFFDTDEPTYGLVRCGTVAGGPYEIIITESSKTNNHCIKLANMSPATNYYYVIEATDKAGNVSVDDNSGQCYTFTSTSMGDIYVPSEASTIQNAIEWSWDGSTVWIADGTYTGDGNRDIDFLRRAITVRSENGPENCIIDCQATSNSYYRGFNFFRNEGRTSILKGITIKNGYYDSGGALQILQSSPTIENCILKNNYADTGGGVYNYGGDVKFLGCTFDSNVTSGSSLRPGGGISSVRGDLEVINCLFINNSVSGCGGGMYTSGGEVVIKNCSFTNNFSAYFGTGAYLVGNGIYKVEDSLFNDNSTTSGSGAGIYFDASEATVDNCVFENNSTYSGPDTNFPDQYRGGAIYDNGFGGFTRISNCVFNNNSAQKGAAYSGQICHAEISNCIFYKNEGLYGGAIHATSGSNSFLDYELSIGNSTFAQNTATYGSFMALDPNNYSIAITNCIVWDGLDPIWTNDDQGTIDINYSNIQGGYAGEGNVNLNPLFVDLLNDDYHLDPNSPCINAGDPDYIPEPNEVDIDGDIRVLTGRLDMGYDEYSGIYNYQKDKWYLTIQAAIDDANTLDIIELSPGTYTGNGNRDIDFAGKAVTLRSINPDDWDVVQSTIIDCQGTQAEPHFGFKFVSGEGADSVIEGISITNGYSISYTYDNSTIWPAGAIFCDNSSPIISQCFINNNNGGALGTSGGITCLGGSSAAILNCIIKNNTSASAGGIAAVSSPVIIINCILESNNGFIGGVYFAMSNGTIRNCLVYDNVGSDTGGVYIYESNSTLRGNTITDNFGNEVGGVRDWSSSLTIMNSIIWNNDNTSGISEYQNNNNSTSLLSYCDIRGGHTGTGNINSDPLFADPNSGDYHILSASPCVNAGDPNSLSSLNEMDIDGDIRVLASRLDMGYDEHAGVYNYQKDKWYLTIQAAIDDANELDAIVLSPGTYVGDGNRDIDFGGKAITLQSIDPNDWDFVEATIIDCQGSDTDRHRGFYFHSGENSDSVVSGVTITNGYSPLVGTAYKGDVIFCENADPTIKNCVIAHNGGSDTEDLGGTVYCDSASPEITDCIIRDNFGGAGGGAIRLLQSYASISNCFIENNSTDDIGGGICVIYGLPTIENCIIANNISYSYGGGVLLGETNASLNNCTIVNNEALIGDDMFLGACSTSLTNCIVPSNGISVFNGSDTFSYCDVEGSGGSGANWDTSLGTDGGGNIDADPLFVDPNDGDYHLTANSPCIDAGDNTTVISTEDIDGDMRRIDDTASTDTGNGTAPIVDIGADEALDDYNPTPCKGDEDGDGDVDMSDYEKMTYLLERNKSDVFPDSCAEYDICQYIILSTDPDYVAILDFDDDNDIDTSDYGDMVILLGNNAVDVFPGSCAEFGICQYRYTCP